MNNTYMLLLLLGSYYGFLATLPLGPSKLLCVRNFLITTKGSERFSFRLESAHSILIAGISGLIIAQIIILLSIYFPSLYALWLKPHIFNLIFIPTLFFYWHKIRLLETNTYNDEVLGNSNYYKTRIQTAFLETLFIQLLNPIVLPDAIFSRLMSVFLFRYSNLMVFISGICLGIVGGYTIFFFSTSYLLQRLEQDTPTIYRLVKRVIHQLFFPIFFVIGLIYLGRAPVPSIKNFTFHKESWQEKPWPDIFYSYDTWKRPLRFLKNNQTSSTEENIRAFNKMYFSQYFFEIYTKDGKQKLYHNVPESVSIIGKDFNKLLQIPEVSEQSQETIFDEWIKEKENRKIQIQKSISNRLLSLEKGLLLEDIIEKKLGSISYNGTTLSKEIDPRLGIDTREKKSNLHNKSPLLLTETNLIERNSFLSSDKSNLLDIYTNNRIKLFLSKNINSLQNIPQIQWIEGNNIVKDKENLIDNFHIKENITKENWSIEKVETLKNKNIQSWNNLVYTIQHGIIGSNYKKTTNTLENATNSTEDQNTVRFVNMYKVMPSWNSKISRADLQTPEPNEFRSILANFVRHLLPGSMRARRRKALSWNLYQNRPHSPIFLHALDSFSLENALHFREDNTLNFIQNDTKDNKQNVHILKTRWNFPIAHFVRGIALCSQAYIRRYIKLPVFIILKNISRQILFQSTEWQKDWTNLAQEVYVDCDYDGNDLYVGVKLPNILELTGKQVKIIRPFRLRYSQTSTYHKNNEKIMNSNYDNISNSELDNYSYLTIWGNETSEPFGKIKKQPVFLQPILQRINLILHYKLYKKYNNFLKQFKWIIEYQKQLNSKIFHITNNLSNILQGDGGKKNVPVLHENTNDLSSKNLEISSNKNENIITLQNSVINKKKKLNQNHTVKKQKLLSSKENLLSDNSFKTIKTKQENNINAQKERNLFKKHKEDILNSQINLNEISDIYLHKKKKVRKYNIKNSSIYLQKNIFYLQRSFILLKKNISYKLKQNKISIYRKLLTISNKILEITEKTMLKFRKYILHINIWLRNLINKYILVIQSLSKKSSSESFDALNPNVKNEYGTKYNINLSQAYILHKIWEENELNRPNVTILRKLWNQKKILNKNVYKFFNKKGIINNDLPENIQYKDWAEWLKTIPGYRPSLKVWQYILPYSWTNSVSQYWKELVHPTLTDTAENYDNIVNKQYKFNYLSYHTPLFEKTKKFHKISQLYLLTQIYTQVENINNIYTAQNNQLTQTPQKETRITPIENDFLKELPIIQKEITRINSDVQLNRLKDRIVFPVSRENQWRSNELKNRFRNLMKAAKQRNVLKESMLDKKHAIELPDQMRKDLIIFYQNFQPEDILFLSILENWRYKVLDDELLMFNMTSSFLKCSEVEHNALSIEDSLHSNILNTSSFIPEELLLPHHVRELRILESFKIGTHSNSTDKITETNNQFVKKKISKKNRIFQTTKSFQGILNKSSNKDTITRFLWPNHRLEDLAYMNRSWLGTSNQSRFSLLRIRPVL